MSDNAGVGLRRVFGVVLLAAWGVETVVWLASTVTITVNGNPSAAVTAVVTLALFALLAGMEGLEVAVISGWRSIWPRSSADQLARWLAARQLFVALIVTTATLLARRDELVIPGRAGHLTSGALSDVFDITWTGLSVLWLAQIAPKALAATDPDRYLRAWRRLLFPWVETVRLAGISQPGEWVARLISRVTGWSQGAAVEPLALDSTQTSSRVWAALLRRSPHSSEGPLERGRPLHDADK